MAPTTDEQEEFLLSCRYGDLDDVKQFILQFGVAAAAEIRDDNGNTPLHMLCGKRPCSFFVDVLDYLLPIVPPTLLSARNSAQSTPLHWAALNSHLEVVKKLMMKLDVDGDVKEGKGDDTNDGEDLSLPAEGVEIEIEDADGQMAKMRIGGEP
ncbi:hypothetical protein B0H14DRAFT_2846984 [Mycena olivaceomarginata]|nr:hypothetical protein B0H14DRAFT_2846984 [Mycena olivaceomarginata]